MIEDRKRPSRLSGFRVCLRGNGNASTFANPAWDFYLTAMLFGWLVLVVLEQTLSITRRGRGRAHFALRAASAITLTTIASCGLFVNVAVLCH
ncbi:hypothetical protein ABT023_03620 [Micromonospora sp. NPDC002296]|uniref:hypothetical protein n=1 Tax=Micromonospora sp. NPDC002296 TaxID=3154271 RepID=UPI003333C0F6